MRGVIGWLVALMVSGAVSAAEAGSRVALVIGNSAYQHTEHLANPRNDARSLSAALRRLDFQVVDGYDLTMAGFRDVLASFGRLAAGAELAVVYYAGHGMEVNGTNYALPVDARLAREQDLNWQVVPLDFIQAELSQVKGLKVLLLDACRDNPLAAAMARSMGTRSASVGRGLAESPARAEDILIAYATAAGDVAEDGSGNNSPFAEGLLAHIEEPGLEIRLLFGKVRDTVRNRTAGRQTPYIYNSLGGREYYLRQPEPPPPEKPTLAAAEQPQPFMPAMGLPPELMVWQGIKDSARTDDFSRFLEVYPSSPLAPFARARLAELTGRSGQPGQSKAEVSAAPVAEPAAKAAAPASGPPPASQDPSQLAGLSDKGIAAVVAAPQQAPPPSSAPTPQRPADGPVYRVAALDLTLFARTNANIRAEPSAASQRRGTVKPGDRVTVTGRAEVDKESWYRLRLADGGEAFILARLVGTEWNTVPGLSTPAPATSTAAKPGSGRIFRDCATCPEMVEIPSGRFLMGDSSGTGVFDERPTRPVWLNYTLAVGKYEVTRGEFAEFVRESRTSTRFQNASCGIRRPDGSFLLEKKSWSNPGLLQSDRDPVTCVSWEDAKLYVAWLNARTGKAYRLLTEAEWEYAARGMGTAASLWPVFGYGCAYANIADRAASKAGLGSANRICDDGVGWSTAPVGSYRPNEIGLFDMVGNVREWVEDCYNSSYADLPQDGKAYLGRGSCGTRVLRGGAWDDYPRRLTERQAAQPNSRTNITGFRVARRM